MKPDEFIARARSLLPVLRERASYAEQLRRIPDETVKDLQEAGLFRGMQPARYGGYELDPATFYRATAELGRACGSTSWIHGVVGVHNWQLGLFPARAQEDVWGEDPTITLSTSLPPTGTVKRAPGGYVLQGRWSYSSGCDFCRWVILGGVVPSEAPGGRPDRRNFLVPRTDYIIEDNWHVVGLCGTGSKDILVEEAFVPEYRTFSLEDAFHTRYPGAEVNTGPIFRLPYSSVSPFSVVGPAIGVAMGALELFRDEIKDRVSSRQGTRVAEDPFIHLRVAEAAAEVDAAQHRSFAGFDEMMALVLAGREVPLSVRARHRWDCTRAVGWSVSAVDRLFEAAGSRALFLSDPLQRAWRDIHAMRAHANNVPEKAAAIFGRAEFGLPHTDTGF